MFDYCDYQMIMTIFINDPRALLKLGSIPVGLQVFTLDNYDRKKWHVGIHIPHKICVFRFAERCVYIICYINVVLMVFYASTL